MAAKGELLVKAINVNDSVTRVNLTMYMDADTLFLMES